MQKKMKETVLNHLLSLMPVYLLDTQKNSTYIPDPPGHWADINNYKILYAKGKRGTGRLKGTRKVFIDIFNFEYFDGCVSATLKSSTLQTLWIGSEHITVNDIDLMQKLYNCADEFKDAPLLDITRLTYD